MVRVGRTQKFSATVQNASASTVTWAVNGIAGGNSTVGKISSAGVYTAPSKVPSPAQVTVIATSTADASKSASASASAARVRARQAMRR
jgi:ribosomal protein S12 methylthiotransferase accessory factor YcaO